MWTTGSATLRSTTEKMREFADHTPNSPLTVPSESVVLGNTIACERLVFRRASSIVVVRPRNLEGNCIRLLRQQGRNQTCRKSAAPSKSNQATTHCLATQRSGREATMRFRKPAIFSALTLALILWVPSASPAAGPEREAKGGFRLPAKNGWTFVHLQGTPHEIGFQNGYLLAPEIEDGLKVTILEQTHASQKDWQFFRDAAQNMMWPHIEPEYREELQGITDGVNAHGIKIDLWDVVALNAAEEWSYYVKEYDRQHGNKAMASRAVPEHCSAFVATGSYTKDGKAVIAHNNWTDYLDGERWTIIYDIVPASGKRMLMDGLPGVIHSADDFVMNSAGIVITETTIGHFSGYDPNGIPEFVRARKAAQYSESIDDFTRIMNEGNNGGYANTWLIADTRHNEIGRLEQGLKNVTLERKSDGYFVGSNF